MRLKRFLIPRWLRSLNIGTGQKGADGFPVLYPYNDSEVNRRKTSQNSLKNVMQHKNPHITLEITAFALAAWVLLFSGQWREAGKISTTQMAPFVSESDENIGKANCFYEGSVSWTWIQLNSDMCERKQEWKNGERKGTKQHREKESKEKGIDLTVCNTLAFQSVRWLNTWWIKEKEGIICTCLKV